MKVLKTFLTVCCMSAMLLGTYSCTDWGQADPPAAAEAYPTHEVLGSYSFKGLTTLAGAPFIVSTTGNANLVYDGTLYSEVLELNPGTATMANPLKDAKLKNGAGVTMWVKSDGTKADDRIFTFKNGDATVSFLTNGLLEGVGATRGDAASIFTPDTWQFLAVQIGTKEYKVYVDGQLKNTVTFDENSQVIETLSHSENLVLGGDTNGSLQLEKISVVTNDLTAADIKTPTINKDVKLPEPVYFNDFESTTGLTIVGGGKFITDSNDKFGKVFQNVASSTPRTNYLLLPTGILSHSAETKEMTIAFWVSAEKAGTPNAYTYAPFFGAYGAAPAANGNESNFPMLVLQSRGLAQINNGGWCDFTPAQNVDGKNHLYNDNTFVADAEASLYSKDGNWLEDQMWHHYAITFSETQVTIWLDGEVKNQWNLNGGEGAYVGGLFEYGGNYQYICLGGNQAWNWGDNDAGFMFDDFAVYDQVLTEEHLEKIVNQKINAVEIPEAYYRNKFESEAGLTIMGNGTFVDKGDAHGKVFRNGSGAQRTHYLLLPDDLLSHSAESFQLSIGFWVNAQHAGASNEYMWAPLFMAYGAAPESNKNTWPMFACQYRGVLQVNCNGYTDYTDSQNTAGANTLWHNDKDWLADGKWHYYTVVLNGENAKVYLDGALANEWNNDGTTFTQTGLFTNGGDLKYICLGGNQAWDWGDNDAGFELDDIQFWNTALSPAQIQAVMSDYQ